MHTQLYCIHLNERPKLNKRMSNLAMIKYLTFCQIGRLIFYFSSFILFYLYYSLSIKTEHFLCILVFHTNRNSKKFIESTKEENKQKSLSKHHKHMILNIYKNALATEVVNFTKLWISAESLVSSNCLHNFFMPEQSINQDKLKLSSNKKMLSFIFYT